MPMPTLKVPKKRVTASAIAGVPQVRHQLQLKRGPLRGDGDEEDQRRNEPQVRTGGDLAQAA